MQWLKDVHVHNLPDNARSAVITGNEDAPDSIAVYDSVEPLVTDTPILQIDMEGYNKFYARRREPNITVQDFTEYSGQWLAFQNKYR